jgi:hypothetical protein
MHPYKNLPNSSFWRRAVVDVPIADFDPVVSVPFKVSDTDVVATAGSCFAQHISRHLKAHGINVLYTEEPTTAEVAEGARAIYSARFGNIYTTRQLLQLVQRCFALSEPTDGIWRRESGEFVDPFRPEEFKSGFATEEELLDARQAHYRAVRQIFETATVFVFTLGLTECWINEQDGFAVPLAPGVVAQSVCGATYAPRNLTVMEMIADLNAFVDIVRTVRPNLRFIFTVSPVPLIATFEAKNVLVATTYSKSALRVCAEQITQGVSGAVYFPSYEIISAHPLADYFEADLRTVSEEGVSQVMATFSRHFLGAQDAGARTPSEALAASTVAPEAGSSRMNDLEGVICEEELLEKFS